MSILFKSAFPQLSGLETAAPFVEKVIQEEYESYDSMVEKIFNVGDMKHGIVQHSQVSSIGPAEKVGEGAEIPTDRMRPGYLTTYKAEKYAKMLATTEEMIEDERFDIIAKNPRRFARSFKSAEEMSGAAVFNNGFSTNGADGVPLFSASHPLSGSGGTSSNILGTPADLSLTSLKDLNTVLKKTLDSSGNRIRYRAATLLVPSELEYLAFELTRSIMAPEGSLNNVNSMGPEGLYKLNVVSWEYLTDSDAFFLIADKVDTELWWFWQRRPKMADSTEFKTEVALTKMVGRWAVGYSDWRGIVGTQGA